jgi:hypothetical protein
MWACSKSRSGSGLQCNALRPTHRRGSVVRGIAAKRPELKRVLDELDAGDVLVVTKLDRLSRSTLDLLRIIDQTSGARSLEAYGKRRALARDRVELQRRSLDDLPAQGAARRRGPIDPPEGVQKLGVIFSRRPWRFCSSVDVRCLAKATFAELDWHYCSGPCGWRRCPPGRHRPRPGRAPALRRPRRG